MIAAALSLLVLTQAEPANPGLTDAYLVNVRNGSADVWLALDGQPSAITVSQGDGALEAVLDGFACGPREIRPPAGRPVTRLALIEGDAGGCTIRLEGVWRSASAFLGDGGVMIALDGIEIRAAGALQPVGGAGSVRAASRADGAPETAQAGTPATAAPAAGQTSVAARPTALAASAGGACSDSADRLEDTPWDLNVMSAHADCLAGSDSVADAITLYERVLAFEPGHYGAALGLARIRAGEGDTAAAAALFQTAAESARTDGEALAARRAAQGLEGR